MTRLGKTLGIICLLCASADATTIRVPAGSSLQAAINAATFGDVIVLTGGASYANITLVVKPGTGTITIRTGDTDVGLAQPGERTGPQFAGKLAVIIAPANATHAIDTQPGAHGYQFINVEVAPANASLQGYDLIWLGDVGAQQTTLAQVPHDLVFDRCYIHAFDSSSWKRGIALNSGETTISNSYLANFHVVGQECQAILGWNGPGPFHIVNNYIEAAGENLMFGGADPSIPNLRPSDIEIRRNLCSKPPAWNPAAATYAGIHWTVKNALELKNARRVVIDGNIFEHNWADAQDGTAIMLTPRNQQGTCPWCGIEDITFTNNIVRHVAAGVNILGKDDLQPSQPAERIKLINNLWYDIGNQPGGNPGAFYLANGGSEVWIAHNTVLQFGNIITANAATTRLTFTDNIVRANDYGVIGTNHGVGNDSLNFFFPGALFDHNVMIAPTNWPTLYPAGNLFAPSLAAVGFVDVGASNYRLSATSPYARAASDGKDVGCDIDALMAAQNGVVVSPAPTPTPTPAPTPSPSPAPTYAQVEYLQVSLPVDPAARLAKLLLLGADGWRCDTASGTRFCSRSKQ